MKRPNITPGPWAAIFNNPLSVLQGHTIKAQDDARTPVGEAFVGRGASKKGIAEQKANAVAFAAVPDLLEAMASTVQQWTEDPDDLETMDRGIKTLKAALTKAGYTF